MGGRGRNKYHPDTFYSDTVRPMHTLPEMVVMMIKKKGDTFFFTNTKFSFYHMKIVDGDSDAGCDEKHRFYSGNDLWW